MPAEGSTETNGKKFAREPTIFYVGSDSPLLAIVSGPSGIGKDQLIATMTAAGVSTVTPFTTRSKRPDEVEGLHYHFISPAKFKSGILSGAIPFWDFAIGQYYGYPADIVHACRSGDNYIIHSLARMALRIRSTYPDDVRLVFLSAASRSVIAQRLDRRRHDAEERLLRDHHWNEELTHATMFDVVLEGVDTLTPVQLASRVSAAVFG